MQCTTSLDIDADELISEAHQEIRHLVRNELHNLGGTGYIRDALLDIPILEIINQQQQHHEQRAEATAQVNADLTQQIEKARAHYGLTETAWTDLTRDPSYATPQ